MKTATFAGGCFWCMVQPFDTMPGIEKVVSGYTGGTIAHPTYEQVKSGDSGHYEAVQITYNPALFSYEKLLAIFWSQIDPTDAFGQFQDRGLQYRAAIFTHDEEQRLLAEQSKQNLIVQNHFKAPIVTQIIEACVFFPAEEEHQNYYKKQPKHYKEDRMQSGRDEFIRQHWQKENV
ncbi:MAG: peptide-methionine (S)-S-oxide reductase MsrA [Bacilli bacterium]